MSEARMLSVKEFAAETGWSTDTIRRRIRRGFIKAFKLPSLRSTGGDSGGNEYFRIPPEELKKWRKPS